MRRTLILPGSSVHSGRPCAQRRAKSAPSASAYAASSRATIGGSSAGRVVEQRQRLDVGVEVRRNAPRPATACATSMFVEAPQIVERHRRQRRGQLAQLVRRRVQPPALVGRADDEHAHVARARRRDRGQVVLEQVVGVQVDVVEPVGRDDVEQQARRRVRREADVADAPGAAEPVRHLDSCRRRAAPARRSSGVFSPWNDSRSIVSTPSNANDSSSCASNSAGSSLGPQLRLQHERAARVARQRLAQLRLAGAVAARGLEVVDPDRQRARHHRVDVGLAGGADPRAALPALLRAHAAAREDRHVDLGSPETPVEHGPYV